MDKLILIDKPVGWTSFDVVNFVRRRMASQRGVKPLKVKVGHIGTLDPLATGLLVLAYDEGTKQIMGLMKRDKTYSVGMRLGMSSTTDDDEGEKQPVSDRAPEPQEVVEVVMSFLGDSMQVPPPFSAIKVNGKRAYDLAREGKTVELAARPITVSEIRDIVYDYPTVTFTAHVSSGTYIRSLVRDIGDKLGTGAYMTSLRRTSIGEFSLGDALTPKQWEAQTL